jgi:SpoVK/Ycf46/Vps4 family AAA+-type ATPase
MDQDKWLAAATMGGGRTAFDLAQAKSMKEPSKKESSAAAAGGKQQQQGSRRTLVMADDYESGMRGLQRAAHYRKEGNLEKAKKIYVLSIELLMEVYKARKEELGGEQQHNDNAEVSKLIRTIENAVKETEKVQASLASSSSSAAATNNNNHSPSSLASFRQNSFDEIAASLQSAVGRISSSKKKKTTTTTTNTTRKKTSVVVSPKNTTTPPQHQQLPAVAADELTNTVLADFYVPPGRMEQTQWDDIAGLATVKQSLQEVAILPLIRPDLFTGLRRTQNILLYGPPGTGKTMLVRAVAVESQSHLFVCSAAVVTSKWLGEAEKMVRRLFQIAHEIAYFY